MDDIDLVGTGVQRLSRFPDDGAVIRTKCNVQSENRREISA